MTFDSDLYRNNNYLDNPWDSLGSNRFLFPIAPYNEFIIERFSSINEWKNQWIELIKNSPDLEKRLLLLDYDWVWGIYLPFLSQIHQLIHQNKSPTILGLTGLPGTGKSTFSSMLSDLANVLGYSTFVLSLDDFYLPSPEIDYVMNENPWKVPRGYPGSHSIELMLDSLKDFLSTGVIKGPKFDKSLRNGKGDRSGWQQANADILILEGWFLGVTPFKAKDYEAVRQEPNLFPPLTKREINYRSEIQINLSSYTPIWDLIENIWHIKPMDFHFTSKWKEQQENNLFKDKGASLKGDLLRSFIRMIHAAIPQESLLNPRSNSLIILNQDRRLNWVGSPTSNKI